MPQFFLVSSDAKSRTTKNPQNGIMNGMMRFVLSAIMPMRKKKHPPIGVIMSREEALLVRLPKPCSDSEKMVGNIIASKR